MSILAANTITPSKLLSGGGDGVRSNPQKSVSKRTPVPSCRRFATRINNRADAITTPNKKIEKALTQLSNATKISSSTPHHQPTPTKTTLRSQSMAELAPSKQCPKKRLIESDASGRGAAKKRRSTDAGHLIYQQLVLNAWRRRRSQVSTLIESSDQYKAQVSQLQIQVDVLQKLRESECKRRDSSVSENQVLKTRLQELEEANQALREEKETSEALVRERDEDIVTLKTNIENSRNDLIAIRSELKVSEEQLERERNKIYLIREESKVLQQKMKQDEKCIAFQKQKITAMINDYQNIKQQLQDVIDDSNNKDGEISTILLQLKREQDETKLVKMKLDSAENKLDKLNGVITAFKKNFSDLRKSKEKLIRENEELKAYTRCLEEVIRDERTKPWWKTARQLLLTPMSVLHSAAYIMLPALPPPTYSTSPD